MEKTVNADDFNDLKVLLEIHAQRTEDAIRRLRRDVLAAGIANAYSARYVGYTPEQVYKEADRLLAVSDSTPL